MLERVDEIGHPSKDRSIFCSTRDDRHPAFSELQHDLEDLVDDDRREAERGFVEEQKLRAAHQRAADGHHLLLAARQPARRLVTPLAEDREQAVYLVAQLGEALAAAGDVAGDQVLLDRELEHPPPFGQWPMPRRTIWCGFSPTTSSPLKRMVPLVGRFSPLIVRSSVVLPATIGTDEADDFAGQDLKADAM